MPAQLLKRGNPPPDLFHFGLHPGHGLQALFNDNGKGKGGTPGRCVNGSKNALFFGGSENAGRKVRQIWR